MFDHHYVLTLLPDINDAGVSQEYDCNEPPNEVFSEVVTERWYIHKAYRKVPNMALYVRLIAFQIESIAWLYREGVVHALREAI